jgi:hypothetical protein
VRGGNSFRDATYADHRSDGRGAENRYQYEDIERAREHSPSQSPELKCVQHDGIQDMFYAVEQGKMLDRILNEEKLDNDFEFFLRPLIRR